eukprot:COSAG01_NODE_10361_length_2184_cov_2.861391_2_plen_109_part_00
MRPRGTAFLASASRQDNKPNRLQRPPLPRYSRSRVVRSVGSGATAPPRTEDARRERATDSTDSGDWFRKPGNLLTYGATEISYTSCNRQRCRTDSLPCCRRRWSRPPA